MSRRYAIAGTPSPLTAAARTFLEKHVPPPVLEVFPEWQGCLITPAVLERPVWVVRNRQDGKRLAEETGEPAILLNDVLAQKGRNSEEAREALMPRLITPEESSEREGSRGQYELHERP
jgi:hypothetical protein